MDFPIQHCLFDLNLFCIVALALDCFGFYVAWSCLVANEVWALAIIVLFVLSLVAVFHKREKP
jgi:hypothetical protein